jgi:outer membrane protein TolC
MQFSKFVIYPLVIVTTLSGCGVKPRAISIEEVADNALNDINQIYQSQEPVPKVLTLSEAMARALKYNLDNRVKLMEQAVAHKSVEMAEMDMLPMLGVSAGYLDRNNLDGSSSRSILTNRQSLEPSTSQDRRRFNADIRFTWNILDFGVSYMQARQNADRYLISEKTREKVMLKLLQQVRSAYWRAVAMQKMSKDLEVILKKVDVTLSDLKAVREQQLYTPLAALTDIRTLVETQKELENMKESISIANVELASLINVPSKTQLTLEIPDKFDKNPILPKNINDMELTALVNSTDYISEVYNVRIDQAESHKALLRLLPGIEFSYAGNYASNSFLWNSLWGEAGVRLAGDLLKLLTVPDTLEYKEISHNLAVSKRQAVNTSVIAGVHLAWQNYANALKRLEHSNFLTNIDNEIAQLTRNSEQNQSSSEVEAIQNEFRAFSSQMAHLLAYAKAQDSYGGFLVSLGSNPVPETYQNFSVKDLASLLNNKYKIWESGKLELTDINQMQKRIAARKKKEQEQSFIDALLEEPIVIDTASIEATDKQEIAQLPTETKPAIDTKSAASTAVVAELKKPLQSAKKQSPAKKTATMPATNNQKVATAPAPVIKPPVAAVVSKTDLSDSNDKEKTEEEESVDSSANNGTVASEKPVLALAKTEVKSEPIAKPVTVKAAGIKAQLQSAKTVLEPVKPNRPEKVSTLTIIVDSKSEKITGNVLADKIATDAQIVMTTITGIDAKGVTRPLTLGTPFVTRQGGEIIVQADGSYSYTPPAAGKMAAAGIIETFNYTTKNASGSETAQLANAVEDNSDKQWLLNQPADKYTFQLLLLSKQEAVDALLDKYKKLKQAVKIVHFSYGEQQERYILFYGKFANLNIAKNALRFLPKEFKQGWIRNFIDVQNQIRNNDIVSRKL